MVLKKVAPKAAAPKRAAPKPEVAEVPERVTVNRAALGRKPKAKKAATPAAKASEKPQGKAAGEAFVEKLRQLVMDSLDDDKAEDIVAIDLRSKSSIADWLIIASGRSARQVGAIADHLVERLKATFHRNYNIEGKRGGEWVLIDAGDVIIHLFQPEVRGVYNLEKMWSADFPENDQSS